MTESIVIEYGTPKSFKLDIESVHTLTRCHALLTRELGEWIKREFIVRRALRMYLKHLRLDCKNTLDEREEIIKAIGGEA